MADSSTQQTQQTDNTQTGFNAAIRFMANKRTDTFLLSVRLATLLFTICYIIPFTPFSVANLYQKALLANAAISALRVHQRLPPFRFTREYLAMLMIEDSAHYLFYSIIFISNHPITLVLLPICLFALLHSSNFILSVLNAMGPRGSFGNLIAAFVEKYQRQVFLTIALTEITLMPTILFSIMAGLATIFTPFLYYQFLVLRYSSRRNPYTRQAFHWLRLSVEKFAASPRCPPFVQNAVNKCIEMICRLAPQQV